MADFRPETPMIRSMTGFARRERQFPWGLLAWELKTVNHRFLEIGCRLPEEFRIAEADFRQTHRGGPCGAARSNVRCIFARAAAAGSLEVDAELLASPDPASAARSRRRWAARRASMSWICCAGRAWCAIKTAMPAPLIAAARTLLARGPGASSRAFATARAAGCATRSSSAARD